MTRIHLASLRVRLMVFALLALLPSAGLLFYNASERRKDAAHDVRIEGLRLIDRTSAECQRLIDGSHELLMVMAQTPEVRSLDRSSCNTLFRRIMPGNPQYLNFGMADARGRLLCSAIAPRERHINIGDRQYFRHAMESRGFAVGEYQISRIIGRPAVNMGYPVIGDDGVPRGVVFAALNLDYLSRLSVGLNLPRGADFTIADRKGTIIVRYPDPARWVGRPITDLPEGKTVLRQTSGVADLRGLDGSLRQYIFAPLTEEKGGLEAHVSVSVPHSVAFAEVNRVRTRNMVFLAIVVLLTLLAASIGADRLVLMRVRSLRDATRRVARGDLTARTGMAAHTDELGELARSFDKMTDSLQAAYRDLVEAQRQRQEVYTEVIRCVTQDKFHLVEPGMVPVPGSLIYETDLRSGEDYAALRAKLRQLAADAGMDTPRVAALVQATGEAVTNALKHAQGGRCEVFRDGNRLITRIHDKGPGIRAQDLAATILQPGFSTKLSLGMGYALMLELSDRVWLATGPDGTTVQLEKSISPGIHADPSIAAAMERM